MPPDPPKKGPIVARTFFGHSAFKIELLDLRSETSTEEILSNKCLLLREDKQFQKRKHIAHWQPTTQLAIFLRTTTIFRASSNLVFTIYCAIIRKRMAISSVPSIL